MGQWRALVQKRWQLQKAQSICKPIIVFKWLLSIHQRFWTSIRRSLGLMPPRVHSRAHIHSIVCQSFFRINYQRWQHSPLMVWVQWHSPRFHILDNRKILVTKINRHTLNFRTEKEKITLNLQKLLFLTDLQNGVGLCQPPHVSFSLWA